MMLAEVDAIDVCTFPRQHRNQTLVDSFKIGFREDSIPFAFIDPKVGKQVGFSVDMAGILVDNLSKYFGKKIEM